MLEGARLEIGLELRQPGREVSGRVGLGDPIALSNDVNDPAHGTHLRRGAVPPLKDLKVARSKAASPKKLVRVVDLVLAENLKRRLQVLPQQFDFGWCQHPWFFRGSELPTG